MRKQKIIAILSVCITTMILSGCATKTKNETKSKEIEVQKEIKSKEMDTYLNEHKESIAYITCVNDKFLIVEFIANGAKFITFDIVSEKQLATVEVESESAILENLKFYKDGFVFEIRKQGDAILILYDYDFNELKQVNLIEITNNRYYGKYAITSDFTKIAYQTYDENDRFKSYLNVKEISTNEVINVIEIQPKTTSDLWMLDSIVFLEGDDNYLYYSGFSPLEINEINDEIATIPSFGKIDIKNKTIDNTLAKEIQFIANQSTAVIGFNSDVPKHTTARDHIFVMANGKIEKIDTIGMESEYIRMADDGNAFLLTDKRLEESSNAYSSFSQRLFVDNQEVLQIEPKDFGVDGKVRYTDGPITAIDTKAKNLHFFYTRNNNEEMKHTVITFGDE